MKSILIYHTAENEAISNSSELRFATEREDLSDVDDVLAVIYSVARDFLKTDAGQKILKNTGDTYFNWAEVKDEIPDEVFAAAGLIRIHEPIADFVISVDHDEVVAP